jgi:energy-coupling factor transporter transmembrane protein EcfT
MSALSFVRVNRSKGRCVPLLGTLGYLSVFVWSLGMVLLVRPALMPLSAAACLIVAGLVYPLAFRRLWRPRWLVLVALLILPPALAGEPDVTAWRIPLSSAGLQLGFQMSMRAVVILVAVNGLTASIDISTLAGLFERLGLRGLGFSLGVALNLLPALQQSATHAWHSLRMRGGLRRKRWRGLQLLAITVVTNALRRAEEIALAAEARGFSPERSRVLPMNSGYLDWVIIPAAALFLLLFGMVF